MKLRLRNEKHLSDSYLSEFFEYITLNKNHLTELKSGKFFYLEQEWETKVPVPISSLSYFDVKKIGAKTSRSFIPVPFLNCDVATTPKIASERRKGQENQQKMKQEKQEFFCLEIKEMSPSVSDTVSFEMLLWLKAYYKGV